MVKLFAFAASLREASLNRRLLALAVKHARDHGAHVEVVHFSDFDMPLYNGDLQDNKGFPQGAETFKRHLETCDGFILASPEYNFSIPGNLKNAIDWVSRYRPSPFRGKHCLLLSASPSLVGGNRGLWQTRIPLEALGTHVYPDMFSLASAKSALPDDEETLNDQALQERLEHLVEHFVDHVKAFNR